MARSPIGSSRPSHESPPRSRRACVCVSPRSAQVIDGWSYLHIPRWVAQRRPVSASTRGKPWHAGYHGAHSAHFDVALGGHAAVAKDAALPDDLQCNLGLQQTGSVTLEQA